MSRPKAKRADLARAKKMGEMVRETRLRRGWTQAQLAEKAGCSLGYVRNVEQGTSRNPSLFPMVDLARALRVKVEEITAAKVGKVGRLKHHKLEGKAVVSLPGRVKASVGNLLLLSGTVKGFRPAGNRPQVDIEPVDVWEEEE